MALEGSLKDFGLADIFQLIYVQKKTGILRMAHASKEAKVLFENGLIVTADSSHSDGVKRVGDLLVRYGKITQVQLKDATARHRKTEETIESILVEMNAITKEDLIKTIAHQVKEVVFSLFQWKEGRYSFESTEIKYQSDYWHPINTEFLIMEGVRRIDEWPYIEKKIPNLEIVFDRIVEKEDKVKLAKTEEDTAGDDIFGEPKQEEGIHITRDEMTIYRLIDGKQDVRHLIETGNLGEFETCKALSNLLTSGLIVPQDRLDSDKSSSEKSSRPRRNYTKITIRQALNALIIAGCLVFSIISTQNTIKAFESAFRIKTFYHDMKQYNDLKQIQHDILTYSYRHHTLPSTLSILVKEGYSLSTGAESLEGGVSYEPEFNDGSFNLSIRKQSK